MDYLTITSILIAVCFVAATVLFAVAIFRHRNDWRGDVSHLGFVAALTGFVLYTLNIFGFWAGAFPPSIGRPLILILAIFTLVTAIALFRK